MATIKELQAGLNFDKTTKSIRNLTKEVQGLKKELQDIDKQLDQMAMKKNQIKKGLKGGN